LYELLNNPISPQTFNFTQSNSGNCPKPINLMELTKNDKFMLILDKKI